MEQLVNRLKSLLSQALPGADAQYLMAPFKRQRFNLELLSPEQYRESAVMILICEDQDGALYLPLTERMTYEGVHSGQVSLPGGKYEEQDGDLMHTALRECFEEIGVSDIEVLGKITPLYIPVSNFLVSPFVGWCSLKNPVMKSHEREVKTLIKLKVTDLLNDEIVKQGEMKVMETMQIKTPWFEVEGLKVWGATAMILSELKQLLKTIS